MCAYGKVDVEHTTIFFKENNTWGKEEERETSLELELRESYKWRKKIKKWGLGQERGLWKVRGSGEKRVCVCVLRV